MLGADCAAYLKRCINKSNSFKLAIFCLFTHQFSQKERFSIKFCKKTLCSQSTGKKRNCFSVNRRFSPQKTELRSQNRGCQSTFFEAQIVRPFCAHVRTSVHNPPDVGTDLIERQKSLGSFVNPILKSVCFYSVYKRTQ